MEDLGKVIINGIENWRENLVIAVPFVLYLIIQTLFLVTIFIVTMAIVLAPIIDEIDPEAPPEALAAQMMPLFAEKIGVVVAAVVIFTILALITRSYFIAGAISMAQEAIENGVAGLQEMLSGARMSFASMLGARLILTLIYLAGIVFIVPGVRQITPTSLDVPDAALGLLFLGSLFWAIYLIVLSIVFAPLEYALVVDRLNALDALRQAPLFFLQFKLEVIVVWLLAISLQLALGVVGEVANLVPSLGAAWPFINLAISTLVLQPVITVWWTRLYMTRKEKEIAPMTRDLLAL